MSAAQLYIVGGRLLGIYLFMVALASLPSALFSYFAVSASPTATEHGVSAVGMLLAGLLNSVVWATTAAIIIRYFTRRPLDSQITTAFDHVSFFLSAVKLIGLYWMIDSALRSFQIIVSSIGIQNALDLRMGDLIAGIVGIPAGLFVLKFADRIVWRFLVAPP